MSLLLTHSLAILALPSYRFPTSPGSMDPIHFEGEKWSVHSHKRSDRGYERKRRKKGNDTEIKRDRERGREEECVKEKKEDKRS